MGPLPDPSTVCWGWAACSPFNTRVVQMGTHLNVTKGELSQERKSVYKIEKISTVSYLYTYTVFA